jgi:rhodanese-related sulfurtransferase
MKPYYFLIGLAFRPRYILTQDHDQSTYYWILSSVLKRYYKNAVVVCRTGKRSAKAKTILTHNVFSNVYDGESWQTLNELIKILNTSHYVE